MPRCNTLAFCISRPKGFDILRRASAGTVDMLLRRAYHRFPALPDAYHIARASIFAEELDSVDGGFAPVDD